MKAQYVTDTQWKKVSVVLPIRSYKKILAELEELEDLRAYDRAKATVTVIEAGDRKEFYDWYYKIMASLT